MLRRIATTSDAEWRKKIRSKPIESEIWTISRELVWERDKVLNACQWWLCRCERAGAQFNKLEESSRIKLSLQAMPRHYHKAVVILLERQIERPCHTDIARRWVCKTTSLKHVFVHSQFADIFFFAISGEDLVCLATSSLSSEPLILFRQQNVAH